MNEITALRELIEEKFQLSRERSLALTRLDECEMWLERCLPEDHPELTGLDRVRAAVKAARGGDAPAQIRGFA